MRFWRVLNEWDDELRSAVLRFATGTPKVPVEGFGALKGSSGPKMFTIQKVKWDLTRLPQVNAPSSHSVSDVLVPS